MDLGQEWHSTRMTRQILAGRNRTSATCVKGCERAHLVGRSLDQTLGRATIGWLEIREATTWEVAPRGEGRQESRGLSLL